MTIDRHGVDTMNPDSHNERDVCQFIDERFQEGFETEEEQWTFFSFVDNYLKRISSKNDSARTVEAIFAVCKKYGYIPQYNVSGWSTFFVSDSHYSRDSKFVISPSNGSTMITFSGEMRPYAAFFNRGANSVELSPDGDMLVNFYIYKDESKSLEIWDTCNFRIIDEVDTAIHSIWWVGSKSFYYLDNEYRLFRSEDYAEDINTGLVLDSDTFAFAVDERNKLVLSLGRDIKVFDLVTKNCRSFNQEMSLDSEMYVAKDGFRIFSNGILYAVDADINVLSESDKACISRKLDTGRYSIQLHSFGKDLRGIYADTGNGRYYLCDEGVKSVAKYQTYSQLSAEEVHLIEKIRDRMPFLLENATSNEKREFVEGKLRSGEPVAVVETHGRTVYVLLPRKMESPLVCEAEFFRMGNLPFYMLNSSNNEDGLCRPNLRIIDTNLIDLSGIVADENMKFRSMNDIMDFDMYGRITFVDDDTRLSQLYSCMLPLDTRLYHKSSDDSRFSLCFNIKDSYDRSVIILTDSGNIKLVMGRMLEHYNGEYTCDKPIIHKDDGYYCLEPNGDLTKLTDIEGQATEVLCTGKTILWKSDDGWHLGKKILKWDYPSNRNEVALISEDTLVVRNYENLVFISLKKNECRMVNIHESCFWNVLGLSDTGYLNLVHFVRSGDEATLSFAELNMNTGVWKELKGSMKINVGLSEDIFLKQERMWGSIFKYIDMRKQKILQIGFNPDRPTLSRWDLTKGKIEQSRNGLRANYTKHWVSPVELNSGLYLIATTEANNEKGTEEKDESCDDKNKINTTNTPQSFEKLDDLRPELRLMNSLTGRRFRNGNPSGGIMYGPRGYYLRDNIRNIKKTPDNKFVFATYDHPYTSLQSFDVDHQTTFPESPINGVLLGEPEDNHVTVGLFDNNRMITQCQTCDYKLNPIDKKPIKMKFHARDLGGEITFELPKDKDESDMHWFTPNLEPTIQEQANLFGVSDDDSGKTEVDVELIHVRNGTIKNSITWHTKFVPMYTNPTIPEIKEAVKNTVKFASSEDLTAVFDISTLETKQRNCEYHATVLRGATRVDVEIQSPFALRDRYYPISSPVCTLKDTFTYSSTVNDHTRITRCRLSESGEITYLNSMDINDEYHYVPVFADKNLLILIREDKKLFYSKNWESLQNVQTDEDLFFIMEGTVFLKGIHAGVHRFVTERGESKFTEGKLTRENKSMSRPSEMEMSTGILMWKGGVFTLKI